ncbi:MAG: hypothetical protein GY791_04550 [Alphaproteobacteria bacterium]|nr:hypothetical protein [Alphaproteobacteria bacterium]
MTTNRGKLAPQRIPLRVLTQAERDTTRLPFVEQADPHDGIWVFAYGSLIWNPEIRHDRAEPARIYGYHCACCLRTIYSRGTPKRPGLALGLDRGGSCRGIALRIAPADVATETDVLWRREMYSGVYRPVWVKADTERDPAARSRSSPTPATRPISASCRSSRSSSAWRPPTANSAAPPTTWRDWSRGWMAPAFPTAGCRRSTIWSKNDMRRSKDAPE